MENEGYSVRQETDNQNGASIEKQFSCSECGSQLKTRKSLKRHLRIHLRQPGERILKSTKYECEFCKKGIVNLRNIFHSFK